MEIAENECKDASPLRTVNIIKKILAGLPLRLVEKNLKSTKHSYTTTLYFKGTSIGARGKGVTRSLSRASVYGEFIERLQNMVLGSPFQMSPEVLSSGKFMFSSDEKELDLDYVERLIKRFSNAYTIAGASDGGLSEWLRIYPQGKAPVFTGLPFCNLMDGGVDYLPWQMLTLYRSNGMCAGNTPEEALVQGLSEILERHVNRVVITSQITPPDIPAAYIRQAGRSISIIKEIERTGKYKVIAKDCSLNRGFPVLAVILISLEEQSYMVNFGAHPRFAIALERCLTEALQSYKLTPMLGRSFLPFSFSDKPVPKPYNYINSVRVGRGVYPSALFSSVPSYQFSPWKDQYAGNKKMLREMLSFFKDLGSEVLVRDKSFLGFPSYQIVVPGISEVEESPDIFVPSTIRRNVVEALSFNLPSISPEQCGIFIDHIIARIPYFMECRNLSGFLNFPVKDSFPPDATSVPLLTAMLYYRKGEPDKCLGIISSLVASLPRTAVAGDAVNGRTHLKCVRDYLACRRGGTGPKAVKHLLERFYAGSLVAKVMSDWGDPDKILDGLIPLSCERCCPCKFEDHCLKNEFKALYLKLKEKAAENPVDQGRLKKLALHTAPCASRNR